MRSIRLVLYVIGVLAALGDLALLYGVRMINDGRIAAQTPPLLELPLGALIGTYVVLVAVVGTCWWLLRHDVLAGKPGKVILTILLMLLVVRGAVVSYSFANAPVDRARVVQTESRLRALDEALQAYYSENNELPETLAQLGVTTTEMTDGWGFTFEYRRDGEHGYRLLAIGSPPRLDVIRVERQLKGNGA